MPVYHFGLSLIVLLNLLWTIWRLVGGVTLERIVDLLLAVLFAGFFWYIRIFPLRVQDRLIRLEMRLRLAELLPADLATRIHQLSIDDLIGLRFAGDGELPGLVRQVLDGELRGRDAIKRRIENWQADHARC